MTETTLIYILTAVTGVLAACIIFLMISNKNLIKKIEDMDKSDREPFRRCRILSRLLET